MTEHPVYRLTSIGRPLDPAYATNRAILVLLPLAAIGFAVLAWLREAPAFGVVWGMVVGFAATLGCWALARELAPDDDPAAFVSLVLGLVTVVRFQAASLLLLFTALALTRIVNRSTGLAPRPTDSIVVAALSVTAAKVGGSPLLAGVAALAFALDARLRDGRTSQWIFAGACAVGGVVLVALDGPGLEGAPAGWRLAAASLLALLTLVAIARTRTVRSTGDIGGAPLSVARVRAGLLVGLLVAVQATARGDAGFDAAAPVWAVLAGVGLTGLRSRS
jgi:hypothetical protein